MNPCSVGAPVFPYLASVVLRCAQQAAQLGPRCGSHVMRSWEAEDKRPMVVLLHGLESLSAAVQLDVAVGAI